MIASDQKTASVILILDHTTGLDTVGHFKLLIILYHDTGVQGTANKWCKSLLMGRTQRVKVDTNISYYIYIAYWVPQEVRTWPR